VIVDAARRADLEPAPGVEPSSIRRFPCAAWLLELYYRRETFMGLEEDEKERRRASLSRQWRRRWELLHDKQCCAHLGFFIKEDPEPRRDKKHNPCIYTDRLTDVVNEVLSRARKLPGFKKYAISCFEEAAGEVLKEFRARYGKYAPNWTEPDPPMVAEADDEEEESDEKYLEAVDRIARRCIKYASAKSEDGQIAFYTKLVARFQMQLSELTPPLGDGSDGGGIKDTVPPVSFGGHEKTEKVRAAHFSSSQPSMLVKNAEQNRKVVQFRADRSVLSKPLTESPESGAKKLVEAFVSVGVVEFKTVFISCIDLKGDYRCVGAEDVTAEQLRARIPTYIRRSERQTQSVSLRPKNPELRQDHAACSNGALIQVDDCSPEVLARLAPYSFVTVETSPGNYQAWIALPKGTTEGARISIRERLLRKLKDTGANGGAYNSVRLAGSLNAKEKYRDAQGHLPRVKVVDYSPSLMVAPQLLEAAGLLAAPLPARVTPIATYSNSNLPASEADYHYYLARSGKSDSDKPDRSNADICYAIRMLKMGWPRHHIAARINELSSKARGRRDNYAQNTTDAAARILASEMPTTSASRERAIV
jgi:hypothetical protein